MVPLTNDMELEHRTRHDLHLSICLLLLLKLHTEAFNLLIYMVHCPTSKHRLFRDVEEVFTSQIWKRVIWDIERWRKGEDGWGLA